MPDASNAAAATATNKSMPPDDDILLNFDPFIADCPPSRAEEEAQAGQPGAERVSVVRDNRYVIYQQSVGPPEAYLREGERASRIGSTLVILPDYTAARHASSGPTEGSNTAALEQRPSSAGSLFSRLKTKFRKRDEGLSEGRLFGAPLDSLACFPPVFLLQCMQYIAEHPIEGVFRLSASASAVNRCTATLNANPSCEDVLDGVPEEQRPHLAAALIKSFIRQIPGGLFPGDTRPWIHWPGIAALSTLVRHLPSRNHRLAETLFVFLQMLSAFADTCTRMNADNLATCIGPNLIVASDGGEGALMEVTQAGTRIAKLLISKADVIFASSPSQGISNNNNDDDGEQYVAFGMLDKQPHWLVYSDLVRPERAVNREHFECIRQFELLALPRGILHVPAGEYMADLADIDPFASSSENEAERASEEACIEASGPQEDGMSKSNSAEYDDKQFLEEASVRRTQSLVEDSPPSAFACGSHSV